MRKSLYFLTLVVLFVGYQMIPSRASSHREAPLISGDPQADTTDVYAFMSQDAFGQNPQPRIAPDPPIEPHVIPHFASQFPGVLRRDPRRRRPRRHTPRLQRHDVPMRIKRIYKPK